MESLKSLPSNERSNKELKTLMVTPPITDPNQVKPIKLVVDNKRLQIEKMTRVLNKKTSDQIEQLERKGDHVTFPLPKFNKNAGINYTIRSIMVPTDAEMNRFKEFPQPKITVSEIPHGSVDSQDNLPRIKMINYDSEIRRMIPQYSYCLNRLKRDSIAAKFNEKRNNYSIIKEITKYKKQNIEGQVLYDPEHNDYTPDVSPLKILFEIQYRY